MQDPAARRIWDTALGQLQLQVTRPNYDTWLKDTVGISADNGCFVVGTPSDFVSEWLSAKMGPAIARTVGRIVGREITVRYQVVRPNGTANGNGSGTHQERVPPLEGHLPTTTPSHNATPPRRLNPRFTFDRFITGACNSLATTAARAVAERPGEAYNPLFIYGGPGLGKTHLLQAVGHRASDGHRRVLYTTCEQFTNDFVTAIAQGHQSDFRRKYRCADVLLVDDVQFLAGKERTQEEFFHTFNDLHADNLQVVLSADEPPNAIAGLQGRLCSRFQWGLIADIQPPDEETRLAILQAKALEQQVKILPSVAHLLADRAQQNIRELEGFLNRVLAYADLTHAPITVETAALAIDALTGPNRSAPPSPDAIISDVAQYFNVSPSSLRSASRAKPIAEARHTAMFLLREDAQLPLKQIGRLLGNRDHSTIIHGCRKVSTSLNTDKGRRQLAEIRAQLHSPH